MSTEKAHLLGEKFGQIRTHISEIDLLLTQGVTRKWMLDYFDCRGCAQRLRLLAGKLDRLADEKTLNPENADNVVVLRAGE